jgi:radical SAM superfamily enzyme with C-terminal helix-hairpin-helix motif
MIKANPHRLQIKTAQTLSLHDDMMKRLIIEELNLRRLNLKRVLHTLTTRQKLEKVKISQKLFGQLNKLSVNDLARVIMGNEIWVDCENTRSPIWVGSGL